MTDIREEIPSTKPKSAVIIAALGVLIALALLALCFRAFFQGESKPSRVARAKSDLAMLRDAIDRFKLDHGRYPSKGEELRVLRDSPPGAPRRGPYLSQSVPRDPWGHRYVYQSPGPNGRGYVVESYGADGKPGGTGENADIIDGND